jgi:pimeloyl-ACP methyl ester carboxylesterase
MRQSRRRALLALAGQLIAAASCALLLSQAAAGQTPSAAPGVETGAIAGAPFRIEVPDHWNGALVVYAHGYDAVKVPRPATNWGQAEVRTVFLSRGFAVAQSDFRTQGWAVKEALEDLEALRLHFIARHGKPSRTYLTGHSMGGFITIVMLEQHQDAYDGGLAICGPYLPALVFMTDSLFSMLVTFDAIFPGVLQLAHDGRLDPAAAPGPTPQQIGAALQASPEKAVRYAARFRVKPEAVPYILSFYREILRELITRAGGNPFDNLGTIYMGFGDDAALNRGIGRYAADPAARAYLLANASTTGRHVSPILALHTTDDPIVDPEYANLYQVESAQAGSGDLFVQRFVVASGHCAVDAPLVGAAFDDLVRWVEKKEKPAAGEQKPPAAP